MNKIKQNINELMTEVGTELFGSQKINAYNKKCEKLIAKDDGLFNPFLYCDSKEELSNFASAFSERVFKDENVDPFWLNEARRALMSGIIKAREELLPAAPYGKQVEEGHFIPASACIPAICKRIRNQIEQPLDKTELNANTLLLKTKRDINTMILLSLSD